MPSFVRYLTHPQVVIDPDTPIGHWGLSDEGRARVSILAASSARVLAGTRVVISSGEVKAQQTAEPLARALGCRYEMQADMHENDRSATGYLPKETFEATAGAFFADPGKSVDGWERAIDAQARICRAVEEALRHAPKGDVLLVGHGAVGTLLWCATAGKPIDRAYDQPQGGGFAFAFERDDRQIVHDWMPMERLQPLR